MLVENQPFWLFSANFWITHPCLWKICQKRDPCLQNFGPKNPPIWAAHTRTLNMLCTPPSILAPRVFRLQNICKLKEACSWDKRLTKAIETYRVSQKRYPLLAGDRNKTIRYHYSPSGQLHLSIFNLDSHTLHLKIVHQTPEIQACKVKSWAIRTLLLCFLN